MRQKIDQDHLGRQAAVLTYSSADIDVRLCSVCADILYSLIRGTFPARWRGRRCRATGTTVDTVRYSYSVARYNVRALEFHRGLLSALISPVESHLHARRVRPLLYYS